MMVIMNTNLEDNNEYNHKPLSANKISLEFLNLLKVSLFIDPWNITNYSFEEMYLYYVSSVVFYVFYGNLYFITKLYIKSKVK